MPLSCCRFFKHWVVEVTFSKYAGYVKNSKLCAMIRIESVENGRDFAYETPTGAATSCGLAFDGGEAGMEKERALVAVSPPTTR